MKTSHQASSHVSKHPGISALDLLRHARDVALTTRAACHAEAEDWINGKAALHATGNLLQELANDVEAFLAAHPTTRRRAGL